MDPPPTCNGQVDLRHDEVQLQTYIRLQSGENLWRSFQAPMDSAHP